MSILRVVKRPSKEWLFGGESQIRKYFRTTAKARKLGEGQNRNKLKRDANLSWIEIQKATPRVNRWKVEITVRARGENKHFIEVNEGLDYGAQVEWARPSDYQEVIRNKRSRVDHQRTRIKITSRELLEWQGLEVIKLLAHSRARQRAPKAEV
jgi:hypothetical protein